MFSACTASYTLERAGQRKSKKVRRCRARREEGGSLGCLSSRFRRDRGMGWPIADGWKEIRVWVDGTRYLNQIVVRPL